MKRLLSLSHDQKGFTIVEIILAIFVFGMIVSGLINVYDALRLSYATARQYNEMYTVLSACPEVDRALTFDSLSSTTNCYPNNSFPVEHGGTGTVTYSPSLTVTNTSALAASDPLRTIPDSKVIAIQVGFPPPNADAHDVQLRMLITRNGIGQL